MSDDNDALWNSDRPALGKVVADDGVTSLAANPAMIGD